MSIRNPKLFGLNVLSFFADIENKNLALQNINLPPLDLEIILGSSNAGAKRSDWTSFSRLVSPLHKTLDRFNRDTEQFSGLLLSRAGTDGTLFGNLKINGSLSGNAIRYRYVEGVGNSATVKIADISTSRISAWSSSDPKATNPDPTIQGQARISYGARLGIRSGGSLIFGTQASGVTGPRLQTSITPQIKEFPSEFPTHKVQVSVGGQNVTLYAMKGIPVIFRGFFRNLNATIKLTQLINNTPASWKIVETGNANRYSNYTNQGGLTSTVNYRSSISRERFIQFYYNPDNILDVSITSANIRSLPAVKFQNATRLEFSYNGLREFPDINFVAPNIEELLLRRNPFYLSEFENERKLQNSTYSGGATTGTVLDKIPTGIKRLYLEGTFYGSITQNIFADRFQQLTVFNVGRGGGAYFHPDSADSSNVIPNVAPTVESIDIRSNDFRSIDLTANGTTRCNVNQLKNVTELSLGGNYYLNSGTFSIAAGNNVIRSISVNSTNLPFPTGTEGKQTLETFQGSYARNLGKLVDLEGGNSISYRFDNCGSLKNLYLYAANGISQSRFPVFTNPSLDYLDVRYTNIKGGSPNGNESNVIPRATFQSTPNLRYILIDSGSLLTSPIHPDAFVDVSALYYFWYRSYGRTGGPLPSFSANPNLRYIWAHHNAFTGSPPNLSSNPSIYYVRLSNNNLNGAIPAYKNKASLHYLYLQDNQLTSISKFENLPNLRYFYAHNNSISGEIPDFSECPRLYYLILFNNNFTNYKSGSFKELYNIRYIDLSNNDLSSQAYTQLLDDLYENWKSVNRGGVTINLRGCGNPNKEAQDFITILRSKGWNITITSN